MRIIHRHPRTRVPTCIVADATFRQPVSIPQVTSVKIRRVLHAHPAIACSTNPLAFLVLNLKQETARAAVRMRKTAATEMPDQNSNEIIAN